MGEGLQRAFAATKASRLKSGDLAFLRQMARWQHIASPQDLGPQTSQDENRARQRCKRLGLVAYDGHYWRTSPEGIAVLRAASQQAQP